MMHHARFPVLLLLPLGLLWSSACTREHTPATAAAAPTAGRFHPLATAGSDAPRTPGSQADAEAPAWNVMSPPGTHQDVTIDTDEGTWMSLDVSPDGGEIAFDLLGDLYVIPMAGGEARALTSGIAWDMQPRYSPDGRWIAFTSDRGGGDNIWVLPRQGGEPRQITKEDFRLLNSPVWSPDGQFIAARKHFTGTRSLGSGEIWLYHIAGGQGLQMTEKPNDQQDVGEPAFSPDGRYVYFSQDVTPGPYFQYNKDPHAGIYAIKRLDRREARTETFLSGPGGAIRPTPSPDGKHLAFVRRQGLRTVLFLHDLTSGAERPLYTDLDRDMQETWAIHGVYPAMAWTPDSSAIVFWAGGKLRRVDATTATASVIPFHVKDTRAVTPALRFPVEVHPERFHTRMLRWVQVAPDGKSVVFQALGQLYIRDLSDGKASGQPRRLTSDADVLEHYPSFSRDGQWIVYTTWNDDTLGSVRIVPRRGGKGRVITTEPGHYVEPAFTPDGRQVVFRKVAADRLRSQHWARDPGLYAVPAAGGKATLITRTGSDPHFGSDGARVFFVRTIEEGDKRQRALASVGIGGKDERVHLRSRFATDFRVSPDGAWVAFRERQNAHVAPFPATGRPFDIDPESKALPITRVSRDAGEHLHWSGDSQGLYWSLGPELYARALTETFAFLDGAPEPLSAPAERGIDIGMTVPSYRPTGRVALIGGRVVTMRGDEVIEDGTVLVDGDRITAVGPRAEVQVPADAQRVDARGMTIIPGLVDVHAHGPQGGHGIIPQQSWLHQATLAFGVTTVHDPSNDTDTIFAAAEMARAGLITAPRIFSTGTILYGAETPFQAVVNGVDDARTHLRRMKAVGAFSVKSYNQPRRDQRQQVLAAARELGMMVVPEGGSLFQHNMSMVVDGHTGIEHAIPVARAYGDVNQLWGATDVGYTPTLVVGYGGLVGEMYWYAHGDVFANERLRRFVPAFAVEPSARRRVLASEGDWNHFDIARLCKQLLGAGVEVQIGAHGQREGLAAHWELWMLVQGGMTPHEALRAGTLHGAHYLGMDGDLGAIAPGKLADLAVIEGNPLADIRHSERVRYTVLGGRVFDARTMDELGRDGRVRRRKPLFWEREGDAVYQTSGAGEETHGCGCPGGHDSP